MDTRNAGTKFSWSSFLASGDLGDREGDGIITLRVIIRRKFWKSVNLSELFAVHSLEFRVWCSGLYCQRVWGLRDCKCIKRDKNGAREAASWSHSLPRKESLLFIISITVWSENVFLMHKNTNENYERCVRCSQRYWYICMYVYICIQL